MSARRTLLLGVVVIVCVQRTPAQLTHADVTIQVSNNAGSGATLHCGLDASATSGIDPLLGEFEQPPPPPSEVFDARFVGEDIGIDLGQGVLVDYRPALLPAGGTTVHEIRYQAGIGTAVTVKWVLPPSIIGQIQDIVTGDIINVVMRGTDSLSVPRPGVFPKLIVTLHWSTDAVRSPGAHPTECHLYQNSPNPFNPSTTISFITASKSAARLAIINTLGQQVTCLMDGEIGQGVHSYRWTPDLPSGVYFCQLQVRPVDGTSPPAMYVVKMCLLK